MKINPNIFKAYDIRGKYPSELNEEIAEKIGEAAGAYFLQKGHKPRPDILICEDLRQSSRPLKESLVKGLIGRGINILDGGIGTTPFFYFLLSKVKPDGGIMVTASHNPAEYNGFKLQDKNLHTISLGSGLETIQRYLEQKKTKPSKVPGEIEKLPDFSEEYLEFVSKGIKIEPLRVVIDAAGGAETLFIRRLLARFPQISYKPLFFESDGTFRKHSPNPLLPESQQFIRAELGKGGFRFGVLFDGDSDRIIFFDEKGDPVRADFIFALMAEKLLKKEKGAMFVVTLNVSKSVRERIKKLGGKVKLSPQGYPYLQALMRRHRALAGVELSGHYHFEKTFFRDSTLLPFLLVAQYLSKAKEPLSQAVKNIQQYITSSEIAFPVADKRAVIEKVKKAYAATDAKLSFLDGITFEFPDWWFNLRAANTESVVRLSLEAKNQDLFDEKMKEIKAILSR